VRADSNIGSATGWTQLGTDQTAAIASINNSSAALTFGARSGGASLLFAGQIYAVQLYASVDGTDKRLDIDFSQSPKKLANNDTFTCSTGQTVTLISSGATGARIAGERDLFQGTAANRPVWLQYAGTKYAYFAGIAGFTVSVPLANDTYDVAITYKDATTDTSTVVVGAGVAAFGGTDAKFASKMVTRIVVSKSSVAQATFDPSLYTSGTSFTSSDGKTWTINGGAHIVTRTGLYGNGSTHYLQSAQWPLSQPETRYATFSQISWTNAARVVAGVVPSSSLIYQITSSPGLSIYGGTSGLALADALPLQTCGMIAGVYNSSLSSVRKNRGAASTGNIGVLASSGVTLFADSGGGAPSNAFVSEVAIYSAAHDTATQDRMALYAGRKWGFSV